MKAKISRGGGFRGVLAYVHEKGEAEKVGGNMSGRTQQELTREFGITKKLRPDCKNPVWHCSLALPVGERVSPEKWGELSADFMREMGMDPANFLYDVQRHNDTDFDHIHIVASRIGLDGTLWHGQNDVFKAIETTQLLEQRHGLILTPGFDPEHKKDRKTLTAKEINMGVRTETKPPRLVAQEAVDEVLRDSGVMSAPEFVRRLEALGVRAVPSVASTGTMNGFSFECEGVSFTGSKLGESFKWKQLQQRGIQYVKNRDFEELANARRSAAERVAVAADAGRDGIEARPGGETSERLERVTGADLGAGDDRTGAHDGDQIGNHDGAAELRQDNRGPESGGYSGGRSDIEGRDNGDARENQRHGSPVFDVIQSSGSVENGVGNTDEVVRTGVRDAQKDNGLGDRIDQKTGEIISELEPVSGQTDEKHHAYSVRDSGGDKPINDRPGAGWAARFKVASAKKRDEEEAKKRALLAAKPRVQPQQRDFARTLDPTGYLENYGFTVKKEGRHLSVRDSSGDERYRVTRKDDGHWVTCDSHENGIGDNIALVQELEPGTGFAAAVFMLSGAPSVSTAIHQPPAPVVRVPPVMPVQDPQDVKRGRAYLFERGISLETIEAAEKAGMLRYSARGVLFIGRDENCVAQNIMRRAVDPSELIQKRDLAGTDKRHPQLLRGATDTVLIVEGGADALAAHDIARREKRPLPTVLVTGGANNRGWMQTPWVQKILSLAKKIIVCFEREGTPEVQARTDAAHELQMQKLQEVCSAQVQGWRPPEGVKDMADLNAHQVHEIERAAQQQRPMTPIHRPAG